LKKFKTRQQLGDVLYNAITNELWGKELAESLRGGDPKAQQVMDQAGDQIWKKG